MMTLLLSSLRTVGSFSVYPRHGQGISRQSSVAATSLSATRRRRRKLPQKTLVEHHGPSSGTMSITNDVSSSSSSVMTITKTQARRMKKANLVQVLSLREMNTSGTRNELTARLLHVIDSDKAAAAAAAKLRAVGRTDGDDERVMVHHDDSIIMPSNETPSHLSSSSSSPSSQLLNETTSNESSQVVRDMAADPPSPPDKPVFHNDWHVVEDDNDDVDDARLPVTLAALEAVQHDGSESILLDTNRTYILQVKGFSQINATGTGVGIVLYDAADDTSSSDTAVAAAAADSEDDGSGFDGGGAVWTARKYLSGDRSISLAEYTALVLGLQYAIQLGAKHVIVETDHDVFANQLLGVYPVVKPVLKTLYWKVMGIQESFLDSFEVRKVKSNKEAWDLAKKALATGKSLNMTDQSVIDPMGKDFNGFGKQKIEPIGPVGGGNDMKVSVIDPSKTYLLQFDGGARGNPTGKAGCGMVIYDNNDNDNDDNQEQNTTEVWCGWKYLDPMSNNRAEYHAVLYGLLCAQSLGIRKLKAQGDSELVIKQLNGEYRCRQAALIRLMERTKEAAALFDEIEFDFIYRAQNQRADWLANHAMDTESSHGFDEE